MDNDSTVVLSDEPLFRQAHLTDEEISTILGVGPSSLKYYRRALGMPYGVRLPFYCVAFTGRTMRKTKNFTHVEQFKEWLVAHRPAALAALSKLLADKAALPGAGE